MGSGIWRTAQRAGEFRASLLSGHHGPGVPPLSASYRRTRAIPRGPLRRRPRRRRLRSSTSAFHRRTTFKRNEEKRMKHESKPMQCKYAPSYASSVILSSEQALPPRWKSEIPLVIADETLAPSPTVPSPSGGKERDATHESRRSFRRVRRVRSLSMGSVSWSLAICGVLGCFLLAAEGCSKVSLPVRGSKRSCRSRQTKLKVFPFAGKVLVDRQPAELKTPGTSRRGAVRSRPARSPRDRTAVRHL